MSHNTPAQLEQCPQIIMFAKIAGRASDYQVFRPIRTTARQGNNVVNMVLSQFAMTIVAFATLPLVLGLNISKRMGTSRFFNAATVETMNAVSVFYLWTSVIIFPLGMFSLLYVWTASESFTSLPLSLLYVWPATVGSAVSFISFLDFRAAIINLSICFIPVFYLRTFVVSLLVCAFVLLKFREFTGCSMLSVSACFALVCKSIRSSFVHVEKLKRCEIPAFTFGALLLRCVFGYSIHALDLLCLATCQRLLQVVLWQNIFPNYTTTPPLKQLEEVFA